jgi:hypothetical protein
LTQFERLVVRRAKSPARVTAIAAAVALASLGCPPQETPAPAPPPDAQQLPGRYVAQAAGTMTLSGQGVEDTSVDGRMQAAYIVYPDGRAVITHFGARLDDVDLVVPFLWWEVDRQPLRCTALASAKTAVGALEGSEITLPPGALRLSGVSFEARKDAVSCGGDVRGITAESPSTASISHDPDGNSFAFSGSFAADYEGNPFTVAVELGGDYVNRPPRARLAHASMGSGDAELIDGCPDAKSVANSPTGLRLRLVSRSEDPDPHAFTDSNLKLPRADLQREDWMRSVDGEFAFVHEGAEVEEIVFEPERDHVLVLTVTDQSGARARRICEFFVAPKPK